MLVATRDLVLPTTITGSYPRPQWFGEELRGRDEAAEPEDAVVRARPGGREASVKGD